MGGASVTSTTLSGGSESEDGGTFSAALVPGGGSSRSLLARAYPQEIWRRGEPCLRPERSHVMLTRTPSMDAFEARHRGLVLLATAVGDGEEALTPAALLAAIQERFGVLPSELSIEVACPPHDLWLLFSTEEKCTVVLQSSMKLRCCRRWIKFERWVREIRGTPAALEYKCKLSFEGLPDQAWSKQSVKGLLKDLGGELIEIIPPKNRRELEVMAWLRDPSKVGKVVDVEIPEPMLALCTDPPPQSLEEFVDREMASSYGPSSPRKKKTLLYPVICHMKEVTDRGPLLVEGLPDAWLPNEGEDLTRKHRFSTVLGQIDGSICDF
ncbi:hypothetical protein VPH35_029212 [Triticum aestivum]|uniref:DUF4283 domain-containing protein n=1 Tax=Triticum aestivum TaxID=4565 RepID=A0A3B6C6G3_WHEAT